MKRYTIFIYSLLLFTLAAVGIRPVQAQQQHSSQYALYNYRNDGKFNAFLNEEIDSITYSRVDTLGIEHDEVVMQEVWTPDSLYRIPLEAIDSIGFYAPKSKMRDNLFYIRDYHIKNALSLDNLTVCFNRKINNDSLPSIGQVMLCLTKKSPFEEGFAGKVLEINYHNDRIEVVCGQAGPCDVFERLVIVGTGVSDIEEYEANMNARRNMRSSENSEGIEEIKLPEKWKEEWTVKFLDILTFTSKKPRVRYKYYCDVSSYNFFIGGDMWVDHPDITCKLAFDWDKISKLGKDYKEVKEIWNLFLNHNYDAIIIADREKQLEEKEWEYKIPIPFEIGPFNCVFEFGAMIKPEAVNLKAELEMKTSAFHHIGFHAHGHNPLAPSAEGIDETWDAEGSNIWTQNPCTSFKADVKIDGSLAFGVFARLKASLFTQYLIRTSVGAEAGLKLSYTGDFTLLDSDCNVPNIYGLLKDTNIGVKLYGKVKADIGALPFNLIDLHDEAEYPFWEDKYYLFPHFTKPTLSTNLTGYSRKNNEIFTTTISKSLIPLFSCNPGLAFYSGNGQSAWDYQEALYLNEDPYKLESVVNDIEFSSYGVGLKPGETYRCYPVFKMFGHVWKAGPFTEFTYPMPLSIENPSLILQKGSHQAVRINGGWGDYNLICEPKDIVKAEIEKSGAFSQVRITALKEGTATVKVYDKRSLETATIEIKVFGNQVEGTSITVSEKDIDFGSVAFGEVGSGSFKVTNHGTVELSLIVYNSQTNINNGFIVNGANELQYLQPGKSMDFKVTAKGTGPDHYRMGTIYVYSNATKDPVPIGLKVKGKSPSVKYVDLGLSVKWAECNLGSLEASGIKAGEQISWGETDSKASYTWSTYTHCDGTAETCHDLGNITATDNDAASFLWGEAWRIPTVYEFYELIDNCTWKWDETGFYKGYWVTGPNGNRIFLEAAGIGDGLDIQNANSKGMYFAGTRWADDPRQACVLTIEKGAYDVGAAFRYYGASIRPVYNENHAASTIKVDPTKIEFGKVKKGETKTKHFTIYNTGQRDLKFKVAKASAPFDIPEAGKEFTLPAGKSKEFAVSCSGLEPEDGNKEVFIRIGSDASNDNADFGITLIAGTSSVDEAYAVLKDNILTFYCDDKRDSWRYYKIFDLNEGDEFPAWIGNNEGGYTSYYDYTKVIFDPSFSKAKPTSTYWWFYSNDYYPLTEIQGIEYLNTSNVTNMGSMFGKCKELKQIDVSHFDTSNVTDMSFMFYDCENLKELNLSKFNTSKVENMEGMFKMCKSIKELDLSNFDTSHSEIAQMFSGCESLTNIYLKNFNTSSATDMNCLFADCHSLSELDLSSFDTSNVTDMSAMFREISLATLDLSTFDTSRVKDMGHMFRRCNNLKTIICSKLWNTEKVTYSNKMFDNCTNLVGGKGTKYDSNHTDAEYARIDGGPREPGYFTDVNDSQPNVPAEAVDLGLPSGTLWASCNVGATKPEEVGGYYAWGETEEKKVYEWSNYSLCSGKEGTCHDIGENISGTQYDVAHVKWGANWRMPTIDEWQEVIVNCTNQVVTLNGVKGLRLTSRKNGKSIFLPFTGCRWDSGTYYPDNIYCWLSNKSSKGNDFANYLQFREGTGIGSGRDFERFTGLPVRPVTIKE